MSNGPPSSRATPGCARTAAASSAGSGTRPRLRPVRAAGPAGRALAAVHGVGRRVAWRYGDERGSVLVTQGWGRPASARSDPQPDRTPTPAASALPDLDEPTLVVRAQEGDAARVRGAGPAPPGRALPGRGAGDGRPGRGRGRAAGGADRRLAADRPVPHRRRLRHLDVPHRHQPLPDQLRRRRPIPVDRIDDQVPAPDDPQRAAELDAGLAELGRAVRELPDELRVCWVLRELEGLGYAEIAQITGAEPGCRARADPPRAGAGGGGDAAVAMTPDDPPRPRAAPIAPLPCGRDAARGLGPRRGRPGPRRARTRLPALHGGVRRRRPAAPGGVPDGRRADRAAARRCWSGRCGRCAPSSGHAGRARPGLAVRPGPAQPPGRRRGAAARGGPDVRGARPQLPDRAGRRRGRGPAGCRRSRSRWPPGTASGAGLGDRAGAPDGDRRRPSRRWGCRCAGWTSRWWTCSPDGAS